MGKTGNLFPPIAGNRPPDLSLIDNLWGIVITDIYTAAASCHCQLDFTVKIMVHIYESIRFHISKKLMFWEVVDVKYAFLALN